MDNCFDRKFQQVVNQGKGVASSKNAQSVSQPRDVIRHRQRKGFEMLANITNKTSLKDPDYITAKPGEIRGQRSVSVSGVPSSRRLQESEEKDHEATQSARLITTSIKEPFSPNEDVKMNKAYRDQAIAGADHNLSALSLDRIRLN